VLHDVNLASEYLNLLIPEKRRKALKKGTVTKFIQTWNPFSSHHTEK
jgi:ABC-type enterochelin transport system ATPase subunit